MYGGYYYWDWTYLLVIAGAVLCMVANGLVQSTYRKYERVMSRTGMTGAECAFRILQMSGVTDVSIMRVSGTLSDHYDPRNRVVRLSESTYDQPSVAAVAVAAHECGHVMQHHHGYLPLSIRTALVPAANIGSKLGIPMIFIGFLIPGLGLISEVLVTAGIWIFSIAVLFQVVTLPVEFNASSRAIQMLTGYGILSPDEAVYSRKVLNAAALTYVAAAASSVLQLLRLILINRRRRD